MLVGLLSVGAELVAIIACTVAINKLSEIKRAVTSRAAQTTSDSPATHISCILVRLASLQPTAGVAKPLTSEPTMALWWLTANVNFFAGLVGLKGSSRGVGEPPLRGMYHAGKPLAHRTPKKNLFGSAATVRPQVFPNEATAFHPWLPQRSRRARLCAWAARKLPSGAAWRMQMAGVAWNSCIIWTYALRPGRGCNPMDVVCSFERSGRRSGRWPNLHEMLLLRRMRRTRPSPF